MEELGSKFETQDAKRKKERKGKMMASSRFVIYRGRIEGEDGYIRSPTRRWTKKHGRFVLLQGLTWTRLMAPVLAGAGGVSLGLQHVWTRLASGSGTGAAPVSAAERDLLRGIGRLAEAQNAKKASGRSVWDGNTAGSCRGSNG